MRPGIVMMSLFLAAALAACAASEEDPEFSASLAVAAPLRSEGVQVATGGFGARMDVELTNDGPVTIVLEA